MNYSDAIAKLRIEQDAQWWETHYPGEPPGNYIIAKEVGGALAEGFGDRISFDTFDNCREWGLTFTAGDWTFCCYEHRNSDQIHIEGNLTDCIETWGPYGNCGKYDTIFHADWQEYQAITRALTLLLIAAAANLLSSRDDAIAFAGGEHAPRGGAYSERATRDAVSR